MRFKRVELSPANKRQYLLAVGLRDIELLLGAALASNRNIPILPENKYDRRRLTSICKALGEALEVAQDDNDSGSRVPISDRDKYSNEDVDPLFDITRLEIIDHTKDIENGGGRTVIFDQYNNKQVTSSIQDDGHTLKLFVGDYKGEPRPKLEKPVLFTPEQREEIIKNFRKYDTNEKAD